jgi:type IV secretion system protein VirB10
MANEDLQQAPGGEEGAPAQNESASAPRVGGTLRINPSTLATHLKRKPVIYAVVAGVSVLAGLCYGGYEIIEGWSHSSKPVQQQTATVPDFKPGQRIKTPAAKGSSATAKTDSSASTTPPKIKRVPMNSAVPQTTAAANTQPSPQMQAFEQAMQWNNSASGGGSAAPQPVAAQTASPAQPDALTLSKSIAMMTGKGQKKESVYDTHLVRKEVSPYELLQGSVIPAVLETGIKSDLSGQVTAIVNHPVYNSLNGAYVLIPAGSRLIGTYKSGAAMGQDRVGVMWTRIEFPNGTYMQLGKMEGSSPRGYAGFKDLVNDHTWEIFKNALLLSFIDVGMSIASPTSTSTNTTGVTGNQALQDGEQSLAQTFGQAEAQMFQKLINVAPTITIRPGYAFNVVVAKDLVFPGPYRHGVSYVSSTAPTQPAAPTELNPYGG